MAEADRFQRGMEMIEEVYAGDVIVPPKGAMAFSDLMLESLFAEVWTREEISMRDLARRVMTTDSPRPAASTRAPRRLRASFRLTVSIGLLPKSTLQVYRLIRRRQAADLQLPANRVFGLTRAPSALE